MSPAVCSSVRNMGRPTIEGYWWSGKFCETNHEPLVHHFRKLSSGHTWPAYPTLRKPVPPSSTAGCISGFLLAEAHAHTNGRLRHGCSSCEKRLAKCGGVECCGGAASELRWRCLMIDAYDSGGAVSGSGSGPKTSGFKCFEQYM